MGLPYNPSSFADNKTILEAIEELKQYLAKNPLTSIFGTDRHWTSTTLPIEYILNPQNRDISLGDIVLSGNSYGTIIDVGETDVEVNWWEQFGEDITSMSLQTDTTDTEVIDAPATFTDWIYRYSPRGATQYRRGTKYKLRITYTDINSNTVNYDVDLPIQSTINAIWYYTESDGSKTIYVDTTLDDNTFAVSNFNIPKGADGTNGQDGVSVVGATIDGSNHLILTLSDGNTIDAGALPTPNEYTHSVSITTTSGTFSDSDFAKLGYGDSTIIYTDAYSVSTVYKLKIETASILEFECIDATSKNNLKLIDVNKSTKAYSMTSIAMIKSATIDSGTATSGKVLTANGSGGCSWETAGGGGTTKYMHYISINVGSGFISFSFINTTSTAYTTYTAIKDAFYFAIGVAINHQASGYRASNRNICGVKYSGNKLYMIYSSADGEDDINDYLGTITDVVISLS